MFGQCHPTDLISAPKLESDGWKIEKKLKDSFISVSHMLVIEIGIVLT